MSERRKKKQSLLHYLLVFPAYFVVVVLAVVLLYFWSVQRHDDMIPQSKLNPSQKPNPTQSNPNQIIANQNPKVQIVVARECNEAAAIERKHTYSIQKLEKS